MPLHPNAIHLTPAARRLVAMLTFVVALSSVNVQIASAEEVATGTADGISDVGTEQTTQERGIVIPPAQSVIVRIAPPVRKVWNKINAPDLETKQVRSSEAAVKTIVVVATAYTSDPAETDDSPFTTANGTRVREGILAANFMKLGTRVRIPDYYGDKVFEVHDRMNARYTQRVDIWMTKKADARNWGARKVKIEVLP